MYVLVILALLGLVGWNVKHRRNGDNQPVAGTPSTRKRALGMALGGLPATPLPPADPQRQKMRPLTLGILIFNALMLVWLVAGIRSANDCQAQQYVEACQAGVGVGAAFILVIWALGDVILGVIWLVTRKTPAPGRTCPVCGSPLAVGLTSCPTCGHDFRLAHDATMPPSPGPKAE